MDANDEHDPIDDELREVMKRMGPIDRVSLRGCAHGCLEVTIYAGIVGAVIGAYYLIRWLLGR